MAQKLTQMQRARRSAQMYAMRAANGKSAVGAQQKIARKFGVSLAQAGALLDEYGAPRENARRPRPVRTEEEKAARRSQSAKRTAAARKMQKRFTDTPVNELRDLYESARASRRLVRGGGTRRGAASLRLVKAMEYELRRREREGLRDNPSAAALRALSELEEAGVLSTAVPGEMWRDYGQRYTKARQITDLRAQVAGLDEALDAHLVDMGGEDGFIERVPELAFTARQAQYDTAMTQYGVAVEGVDVIAWADVPEKTRNAVEGLAGILPAKVLEAQKIAVRRALSALPEKPKKPRRRRKKKTDEESRDNGVEALAVARPNPAGATRSTSRRANMARKNAAVRPNPVSSRRLESLIAAGNAGVQGALTEPEKHYLNRLVKNAKKRAKKAGRTGVDGWKRREANEEAADNMAAGGMGEAVVAAVRKGGQLTKAGKAAVLLGLTSMNATDKAKYPLGLAVIRRAKRTVTNVVKSTGEARAPRVADAATKARAEKILVELKKVREEVRKAGLRKPKGRSPDAAAAAKLNKAAEQLEAIGLPFKHYLKRAEKAAAGAAGKGKERQHNKGALKQINKRINALERLKKRPTGEALTKGERKAIAKVNNLDKRLAKVEKSKRASTRMWRAADLRARANPGYLDGLALPWEHVAGDLRHYGVNVVGGFLGGFVGGSIVSNLVAGLAPNFRLGPLHAGAIASGALLAYGLAKGVGPLDKLPPATRAWAAAGAVGAGFAQQWVGDYLTGLPVVGPMIGKALALGSGGGGGGDEAIGDLYDDAFNPMAYQDEGAVGEFYSAPLDGTDAYIQVQEPGMDAYIQVQEPGLGEFYAAPVDGVDGMDAYIQTGPGSFSQPSVDGVGEFYAAPVDGLEAVDGVGEFYAAPVDGLEAVDGLAGEEYLDSADIVSELGHGMHGGLNWTKVRIEKANALKARHGDNVKIYRCNKPGFAIVGLPDSSYGTEAGVPITRSVPPRQPVSMHVPAQFPVMPASQSATIQAQQKGVFGAPIFGGNSEHVFSS